MAQIDLRYAEIDIQDGFTGPGTTNFTSTLAGTIGEVTLALSGGTGILQTGDQFTIAGDPVTHTITAHTETTGNTSSITFTPGLSAVTAALAVLTILPHGLEIDIGDGNLTYDEKRPIKYIRNRNKLNTMRLDPDDPVEVKIEFLWEFLRAATNDPPTIEDALKQRGGASNWVSSAIDKCELYAVNIIVKYVPPCSGVDMEIITLNDFRWESLMHDLKAGMVNITGKCNITEAGVTRQAVPA